VLEGVGPVDLGDVETCITSSLAAMRGSTFLPVELAGATIAS
jgi:hypothetical protein